MKIIKKYLDSGISSEVAYACQETWSNDELLLVLLSLDPYFTELASVNEEFKEVIQALRYTKTNIKALHDCIISAYQQKTGNTSDFVKHLANFSSAPLDAVRFFRQYSPANDIEKFYIYLILSMCAEKGTGMPASDAQALMYLTQAVDVAEKTAVKFSPQLIHNALEKFKLDSFEAKILALRIFKIVFFHKMVEDRTVDNLRNYFDSIISLMCSCSRQLTDADTSKRAVLETCANEIDALKLRFTVAVYGQHVKKKSETIIAGLPYIYDREFNDIYNHIADPDFTHTKIDVTEIAVPFESLCKAMYDKKKYHHASCGYQLLLTMTGSAKIALQLGNMAANGHFITGRPMGQRCEEGQSDFVTATDYYENAIDQAIKVCDAETLEQAIIAYNKIDQIGHHRKLDLDAKIKRTIESLTKLKESAIQKLLPLMLRQSVGLKHLDDLVEVLDFNSSPILSLDFFKSISNTLPKETSNVNREILLKAYYQMIPYAIAIFSNLKNFTLKELTGFLSTITKHSLDSDETELTTQFFDAINRYLARSLWSAIKSNGKPMTSEEFATFEGPESFRTWYSELKIGNIEIYSSSIDYWHARQDYEQKFAQNKTHYEHPSAANQKLYNIYRSAAKVDDKNYDMPKELLNTEHPEAFLKIAQLSIRRPNPDIVRFMTIGSNIIKAMTFDMPIDGIRGYQHEAFEVLEQFTKTIMSKPNREIINTMKEILHFYYSLALLIQNPARFHEEKTQLFKDDAKEFVIHPTLQLLKDVSFEFNTEVRRCVSQQIISLSNIPELDREEAIKLLNVLPAEVKVEKVTLAAVNKAETTDSAQPTVQEPSPTAVANPTADLQKENELLRQQLQARDRTIHSLQKDLARAQTSNASTVLQLRKTQQQIAKMKQALAEQSKLLASVALESEDNASQP